MGFRWIFLYPWIDNVRYVKGQYIRSLKGLYESNYMASWLEFAKYIGKIQHQATYTFFNKIWSFFLKEQYGSTHIILDSNFSNDAQNSSIYISWKVNMVQTVFFWSEFRICKKILENKTQKYQVMKIDENFVEGRYWTIVFCEFVAVLIKKGKI